MVAISKLSAEAHERRTRKAPLGLSFCGVDQRIVLHWDRHLRVPGLNTRGV